MKVRIVGIQSQDYKLTMVMSSRATRFMRWI